MSAVVPGHDAVILTFGAPFTRDMILPVPDYCGG